MLSQTAEYALRIMARIALDGTERPLRAKEIAEGIHCPGPYVSKVLRKLVTAGLLKADKGHGGGFRLARPANQIYFCHVLEAVQQRTEQKHCIFGWRECNAKAPCILHHRWSKVSAAFTHWTRTTSLASIRREAGLSDWLAISGKGGRAGKSRAPKG